MVKNLPIRTFSFSRNEILLLKRAIIPRLEIISNLSIIYSVGRVYGIIKIHLIRSLPAENFLGNDIFGAVVMSVIASSYFMFQRQL